MLRACVLDVVICAEVPRPKLWSLERAHSRHLLSQRQVALVRDTHNLCRVNVCIVSKLDRGMRVCILVITSHCQWLLYID
jgi:hypothetical protein